MYMYTHTHTHTPISFSFSLPPAPIYYLEKVLKTFIICKIHHYQCFSTYKKKKNTVIKP